MSKTIEEIRKAAVASVLREQATQDRLDQMYVQSGRNQKRHPLYSLYTGLYMENQSRS